MKAFKLTDGRTYIDISDAEIGTILKIAHPSRYTTKQLLDYVVASWSANFEQDLHDAIDGLDEEAENE